MFQAYRCKTSCRTNIPFIFQGNNPGFVEKLTYVAVRELCNTASQNLYLQYTNLAYMQVASGAFSYQEAIKQAVKAAAIDGGKVLYQNGHSSKLDVAVRRSLLMPVASAYIRTRSMSGCSRQHLYTGVFSSHIPPELPGYMPALKVPGRTYGNCVCNSIRKDRRPLHNRLLP